MRYAVFDMDIALGGRAPLPSLSKISMFRQGICRVCTHIFRVFWAQRFTNSQYEVLWDITSVNEREHDEKVYAHLVLVVSSSVLDSVLHTPYTSLDVASARTQSFVVRIVSLWKP